MSLALVLALPGGAQNPSPTPHISLPQQIGHRLGGAAGDVPEGDAAEQQRRQQALNRERQKSIVSDTNKLLALANELEMEVRTSNPDTLTPAQLHKVAAIEKLAHSVREKMVLSIRAPGATQMPPPLTPYPME